MSQFLNRGTLELKCTFRFAFFVVNFEIYATNQVRKNISTPLGTRALVTSSDKFLFLGNVSCLPRLTLLSSL